MSKPNKAQDKKDRICAKTLINSASSSENPFSGCSTCEYADECAENLFEKGGTIHAHSVLQRKAEFDGLSYTKLLCETRKSFEDEKITLEYKDVHCLTRHLQDAIFDRPLLFGCKCCRYSEECLEAGNFRLNKLREKLGEMTDLYMGMQYFETSPQKLSKWLQGF